MAKHHISSGGRYPVLRTIAILWLVSGVLAFFVGVFYQAGAVLLAHVVWRIGDIAMTGAVAALIWLAVTYFIVLACIAIAEMIKLGIDIEHNTRKVGVEKEGDQESAESALIKGH